MWDLGLLKKSCTIFHILINFPLLTWLLLLMCVKMRFFSTMSSEEALESISVQLNFLHKFPISFKVQSQLETTRKGEKTAPNRAKVVFDKLHTQDLSRITWPCFVVHHVAVVGTKIHCWRKKKPSLAWRNKTNEESLIMNLKQLECYV